MRDQEAHSIFTEEESEAEKSLSNFHQGHTGVSA